MPDAALLHRLTRPSGTFAMVALDQRESLRTMLEARHGPVVPPGAVAAFKVEAARALTPHASAVLLDRDSGLEPVREAGALADGCGLIVAADALTQEPGGPVLDTDVDAAVFEDDAIAAAADAYKLLVIWHEGRGALERRRVVDAFLAGCRRRGRPGIVEGIVRGADGHTPDPDRHADLVVAAAAELGAAGPDLYKAEVPTLGRADDASITTHAARVTATLDCPWVVLSNGTSLERFPDAAVAAGRGGANGFLAGRALWLDAITAPDPAAHLATVSADRLRALAERIDGAARPIPTA